MYETICKGISKTFITLRNESKTKLHSHILLFIPDRCTSNMYIMNNHLGNISDGSSEFQ